jgi:hypothetical protein
MRYPMIWNKWIILDHSFYLSHSNTRNYIISCIDYCSRKAASRWLERKRSTDVLNILEEWIMDNGKPKKVLYDSDAFQQHLP